MKRLHGWVALGTSVATAAAVIMFAPSGLAAPSPSDTVLVVCTAPAWAEGTSYAVGAQRTYNGRLYEARVAHTPPAGAGWTPTGAASLWRDLGACDGGTPPPPPPGNPPPPPGNPPPPAPPPGAVAAAPYVDMGAWPTPSITGVATSGNLRSLTLAFVTASACKAMWFNAFDPRAGWMKSEIDAIRARGGDVKISFGGATGVELAQACPTVQATQAEYQAVVSAYGLRYIDLDIEGAATADPTSVNRRSQALAGLQRANAGLRVSLTLPVLPEGLTADGLNVVRSARDAGVNIDLVNVMAMDYYRAGDYGDFAVQAANSLFNQLRSLYPTRTDAQLWRMVGVTPMLGQNDDGRIYDQNDARQLVTFARSRHLGMLSFWEMTRDRNACTGALYRCTNIAQQPYEFSRIFAGYTG